MSPQSDGNVTPMGKPQVDWLAGQARQANQPSTAPGLRERVACDGKRGVLM